MPSDVGGFVGTSRLGPIEDAAGSSGLGLTPTAALSAAVGRGPGAGSRPAVDDGVGHAGPGGRAVTTFFTADTHFGDPRALRFDHRPFADLAAHDAELIARWNAAVGPDDTVWHLGDVALGPSPDRLAAILDALNGEKHLIAGNNDDPATLAMPHWVSVGAYRELVVEARALVLCHYAFRTWNGIGRGALNLHGHSHGRLSPMPKQYDVGVDAQEFRPVTLADILASRRRGARRARAAT